jgi:hypothetical protein
MTNEESLGDKFPEFTDFCLNIPLYSSYPFDNTCLSKLRDIEFYDGHLDCYCLECNTPSVFVFEHITKYTRGISYYIDRENDIEHRRALCSRDNSHKLNFYFLFKNKAVTKIGQYPSMADLATYNIRKYTKVLGNERYAEFSRAIGLVSHGVGIGSFVYLRRIIEQLIEEAHQKLKDSDGWDETQYIKSRIDEKIKILKDVLPDFLVTNKALYSILSKGIHELNEQECLSFFNVIRVSIELILDEKLQEFERKNKIKKAEEEISKIATRINKS